MAIAVHLVCYDISDPARLKRVGSAVRAWRACGQRSVSECWLDHVQRGRLVARVHALLDLTTDRLHVLRLDPRQEVRLFGIASRPSPGSFVIT